jgi:hypothetical protein
MVETEFVLLGTDRDAHGIPWALLASDRDGEARVNGPAILNPPQQESAKVVQSVMARWRLPSRRYEV